MKDEGCRMALGALGSGDPHQACAARSGDPGRTIRAGSGDPRPTSVGLAVLDPPYASTQAAVDRAITRSEMSTLAEQADETEAVGEKATDANDAKVHHFEPRAEDAVQIGPISARRDGPAPNGSGGGRENCAERRVPKWTTSGPGWTKNGPAMDQDWTRMCQT
jgi:hypothetical protein